MKSKKGQGLSLNVIIVAALALIVLVVLVAIFTGRFAIFQNQIGGEAKSELQAMKAFYGECHPDSASEAKFQIDYSAALDLDDTQESELKKAEVKSEFESVVGSCRGITSKDSCNDDDSCKWE